MKKVFIIEDYVDDYINLTNILTQYDIECFPSYPDRNKYSVLFSRWANQKRPEDLNAIKEAIEKANPDYIFLDIGLSADQIINDRTGLQLKEELLEKCFPTIPIRLITARYQERMDSILKDDDYGFEDEIVTKFLAPENISKKQVGDSYQLTEENTEQEKYSEPKALTNFRRWVARKFQPLVTYILHTLITIIFYGLIGFLVYIGVSEIVQVYLESHNILGIAETVFVAFLPLLVVFGFFVFYWESLRPYLLGSKVNDMNLESTSGLLSFTKKLFISSLISYLFTKSIELLFLDNHSHDLTNKPDLSTNKFSAYHSTDHPYAQLLAIGIIIVLLSLYYIYLNSHTTSHKAKHPKD